MNYQQFIAVVKDNVSLSLGKNISLEIHTTLKNNDRERVGLTISDEQVNISPTIYLEEYYKQFQDGIPVDCIVSSIVNLYHQVKFEHVWQVQTLKSFDALRSKVVFKLIHAPRNEKILSTMPHTVYLDFAIVFYVLFDVDETGTATIPITNDLMHFWGTNAKELYRLACENAKELLPASLKPMYVVIEELTGKPLDNDDIDEDIMFVLTNSLRTFGAACLLYDGILEQIAAQLNENFYVLPSSIHEVIIIPESKGPEREDLNDMIQEVNETQIDVEEILSDHVYYYDCNKQCLM